MGIMYEYGKAAGKSASGKSAALSGRMRVSGKRNTQYGSPHMPPVGGMSIRYSPRRVVKTPRQTGSYSNAVIQRCGDPKQAGAAPVKSYQTYTKTNLTTQAVYSGRTSGTGTPQENLARRDARHHMSAAGYAPAVLDKSSPNRDAIRGREQILIDSYGGAQSTGGTSGNAINGIRSDNPRREQYLEAARKEFGDVK